MSQQTPLTPLTPLTQMPSSVTSSPVTTLLTLQTLSTASSSQSPLSSQLITTPSTTPNSSQQTTQPFHSPVMPQSQTQSQLSSTQSVTLAQALQSTPSSQQPLSQMSTSSTSSSSPSLTQTPVKNPVVILDKTRLQELVQEVDPSEQLEEEVEEMLLMIADDFIESLVSTSAMIAKHRKSTTLDVKDVQLALEKNWNMWIPGFGADDVKPMKKSMSNEAHKQRMALIRKTLKKF